MTGAPTPGDVPHIDLHGPGELLAVIPYLLGFHPTDSLVMVGLHDQRIGFALRLDLPPHGRTLPAVTLRWVLSALVAQHLTGLVLVGYGGAGPVGPPLAALADALQAAGLPLVERLRVAGDRYWSYGCTDARCCPPTGSSYEAARDRVAAEATLAGLVALPDRAEVARQLAPVTGPARVAVERARHQAQARRQSLVDTVATAELAAKVLAVAGTGAVRDALRRYEVPDATLDDDEVAWLGLMLREQLVRDEAWRLADHDLRRHRSLWTDVVRRVPRRDLAAPAALLGYVCWQLGDGALAGIALGRALDVDPGYEMATLLSQAVAAGVPPHAWHVSTAEEPTSSDGTEE
jgi:uncharacterized protein DUF4192